MRSSSTPEALPRALLLAPLALALLAPAGRALAADAAGAHPRVLESLPAWVLRPGPRGVLWWQWLALPFAALVAWSVGARAADQYGTLSGLRAQASNAARPSPSRSRIMGSCRAPGGSATSL